MNNILIIQNCPESSTAKLIPSEYNIQFLKSEEAFLAKYKKSDIIILDTSLSLNKKFICQKLRKDGVGQPVIIFSENETLNEKIEMFANGADEVVSEKIHPLEFKARLNSLLKRPSSFFRDFIRIDSLTINPERREVFRNKKKISLSKTEFKILLFLVKKKGINIERMDLFENVWGIDNELDISIVDVYIRFLRRKIDEGFKKKLIKTVHGVGYRID